VKRSPLERKTRLRARRATPRRSARVHDLAFMARVRQLPCLVWTMLPDYALGGRYVAPASPCSGSMHAHHMGARGLGQKCSDLETVPFCERHHRDWHDCTGPFADKSKEWRLEFAKAAIEQTRAELR
jgi:hypothetical protein